MISVNATIAVRRAESDPLLLRLRPFISRVAGTMRERKSLCEAVDRAGNEFPEMLKHFIIEKDLSNFGLKQELLFPENDRIKQFYFRNRATGQTLEISDLTPEEVLGIGNTLEVLSKSNVSQNALDKIAYPELAEALRHVELLTEDNPETHWKIPDGQSGIVRLQHASFLLQSSKARVLVDPHFVSSYSAEIDSHSFMLPHRFSQMDVEAVLITHGHTDHYDLPSLMMIPRDTPMIVPSVSQDSILSPRFGEDLRSLGFQSVIEIDWFSGPIRVQDIEIWALPFYGEQPLRYEYPRDRRLRNSGNSYVFCTPEFSTWCLIDSGADAWGSMVEVAHTVEKRFGSIDTVLSNLHDFFVGVGWGNPFYTTGSGEYWLSLTADQIVRLPDMGRDQITLGPRGVAEICATVKAKTFLPYAHLWSDVDRVPADEPEMLKSLKSEPALAGNPIRIESWRMGSFWQPS